MYIGKKLAKFKKTTYKTLKLKNGKKKRKKIRGTIDSDLSVWSGECKNQLLGHAVKRFELNSQTAPCHRPRCTGCTDDLIVAKKAPDS